MIRRTTFFEHLPPLRQGEQRLLGVVVENRDDQPLDQSAAARNQIQVPVGDRVKRTWIDGDSPGGGAFKRSPLCGAVKTHSSKGEVEHRFHSQQQRQSEMENLSTMLALYLCIFAW